MMRGDRRDRPRDDGLDPLFEAARFVEPVSDVARARSLARARARAAADPRSLSKAPAPARSFAGRRTLVVSAAFLLMATGVAAAFLGRAPAPPPSVPNQAVAAWRERPSAPAAAHSPPAAAPQPSVAIAPNPGRVAIRRDRGSAEVAVLRRAQAAYADGDYPAVLDIVGQHARRFSNGRLAEEAEALRVRSLARCGRQDDAVRALDAFAGRFPNSVLLSTLRRSLGVER